MMWPSAGPTSNELCTEHRSLNSRCLYYKIQFVNIHRIFLFMIFRSTWEYFTHLETSPLPVKRYKFWPILMAIEQWRLLNMLHLLWHGVTLIVWSYPRTRHSLLLPRVWQWSCHYLFLTTYVCSDRGSNPDPRMRDERSTAKYTDDFCKALKSMWAISTNPRTKHSWVKETHIR